MKAVKEETAETAATATRWFLQSAVDLDHVAQRSKLGPSSLVPL